MAVIKSQFTLRLDLKLHSKIKKIAIKEKRSMTNMIEYLIMKEINFYEEKHGEINISQEDLFLK